MGGGRLGDRENSLLFLFLFLKPSHTEDSLYFNFNKCSRFSIPDARYCRHQVALMTNNEILRRVPSALWASLALDPTYLN